MTDGVDRLVAAGRALRSAAPHRLPDALRRVLRAHWAVQEAELLFVSDGVHGVAAAGGEAYGERALARAAGNASLLPAADVPAAVLRELAGHRGRPEPDDDALVMCLDWFGRRPAPSDARSPGTGPHSTDPADRHRRYGGDDTEADENADESQE